MSQIPVVFMQIISKTISNDEGNGCENKTYETDVDLRLIRSSF